MGNKVVVVGGGAAGLVAAINSARNGAYTVVLEKNDRVGKKILATGNGRCNYTNVNAKADDYNSDFVSFAMNKFSPQNIIDFFEEIGIIPKIEDEGRVYPMSCQASSVLDVLRAEAQRLGVYLKTDFLVKEINRKDGGFNILSSSNEKIYADKVILSTGGLASPKSGSDGAGFKILKNFGHTVTELKPSLCPLLTDKGVHGVRQYGRVTLNKKYSQIGEIQFNKDSISGIPVFNLARYASVGDCILVDFLPDYAYEQVIDILRNRPVQTMESFLVGILNKNLSYALLKDVGISPLSIMSDSLTEGQIHKIADVLKGWQLNVTGLVPWDNAQVTKGGISLDEINNETMESKLVKGLYVAGELCDVDSRCGGYNLQWAWASGLLAGREAARCID